MLATIRYGILSFAHRHAHFWARAVRQAEGALLVGIWDDRPERGRQAAAQYETAYEEELGTLLRECDAVGITSETANHAPLVEAAARAGVHVLCEKPLAPSREHADRIVRAVRDGGITFMQNFPKRFDPVNHALVDLVHRGDLGTVTQVRVRHGHCRPVVDPTFAGDWLANRALGGGGALLDEGVHAADFLGWLLGPPESVVAAHASHGLGLAVEDTAIAVYRFLSGALGEIAASWAFVAADQSVEVYGTEGTALLSGVDLGSRDFARPPYLRVYRAREPRGRWEAPLIEPGFRGEAFHQQGPLAFIDCLRRRVAPPLGLAEGLQSLEMILAAYDAAATGRVEPIKRRA